jgi:hypothetical protein
MIEKKDLNCLICNSAMEYYFSKKYEGYPGSPFPKGLLVKYEKCENCGFVVSRTHREMNLTDWENLNSSWHHYFEGSNEDRIVNQPPYAEQALILQILAKRKIINLADALDYAAGYGTLSKFLSNYFDTKLKVYDQYVRSSDTSKDYVSGLGKYGLVTNSAMFEHVISRDSLDKVNECVRDDGALMIHTRISEKIPKDSNWFYLKPHVHTAFHTNKSMEILMEQWGYEVSIYAPQAKSWILFKNKYPQIERLNEFVNEINTEIQAKYFYYKKGFVDFWKEY